MTRRLPEGLSVSWKKAPFAAESSRCPARGEYSIDQPQRLWEAFLPERDLAVRDSVDGGRDAIAQRPQLAGAEDDLAHARAPAAEDEVIRSQLRELQLRLLDQEEVLDRLRERPVAVLRRRLQLPQLVLGLGQGEAPVQVDLQRLGRDVIGRDVRIDACVHP